MNRHHKNITMIIVVFALLFMAGCKQEEDPIGPGGSNQLAPVTNLRAYSAGTTSVGLAWSPSSSVSVADFDDYLITVKNPNNSIFATTFASQGDSDAVISGLNTGVIYKFEVMAEVIEDAVTYQNSDVVSITWSPAPRLNDDNSGLPIKVYETSSSGSFGSGLIFFDAASSKPKIVSISSPGSDALSIDAYVKTETNNGVTLKSASIFNAAWKLTRFSGVTRNANVLDDPRVSPPDSITYVNTSLTIDSVLVSSSRIYYFKGDNGNYGRILVQRNATNGTLLWGTSPEQYLNLFISYQTVPYNPYSKTAFRQ